MTPSDASGSARRGGHERHRGLRVRGAHRGDGGSSVASCASSSTYWAGALALPGHRLEDADLVAEGVAQAAVDPVAVVGRLLRELDALGAEPLVGAEAVVGLEHHDDA